MSAAKLVADSGTCVLELDSNVKTRVDVWHS